MKKKTEMITVKDLKKRISKLPDNYYCYGHQSDPHEESCIIFSSPDGKKQIDVDTPYDGSAFDN